MPLESQLSGVTANNRVVLEDEGEEPIQPAAKSQGGNESTGDESRGVQVDTTSLFEEIGNTATYRSPVHSNDEDEDGGDEGRNEPVEEVPRPAPGLSSPKKRKFGQMEEEESKSSNAKVEKEDVMDEGMGQKKKKTEIWHSWNCC